MKKFLCFLFCLGVFSQINASEDFIAEQRSSFDTLSPEKIKKKRTEILSMAEKTLARLYKENPQAKDEIAKAYGYGVFEGQAVNMVFYVAGKGVGVVYDNKTNTPIFMNAIRAGTGPGVGYKSVYGVLTFDNELVFKQFTTVGLQIGASADASLKISGKGIGASKSVSLVPGVSAYQLNNTGIVIQANWGATEFLRDPQLNE